MESVEIVSNGSIVETRRRALIEETHVKAIAGPYEGKQGISRELVRKKSIKIDLQDGSKVKCLRILFLYHFFKRCLDG